jgi:hypothetical protein
VAPWGLFYLGGGFHSAKDITAMATVCNNVGGVTLANTEYAYLRSHTIQVLAAGGAVFSINKFFGFNDNAMGVYFY